MPLTYARRPLTNRPADIEEARRALRIVSAALYVVTGDDEQPSILWQRMSELPGTDARGWELAQDSSLLCVEILDAIEENIDNPAKLAGELLVLCLGAVPEIKDDIEALKP